MSIKIAKKPVLEMKSVSGVKLTMDDYTLLERYGAAYKEAYGEEISLGDLLGVAAMEFIRSDKNFMKTV